MPTDPTVPPTTSTGDLTIYHVHPGLARALSLGRLPGRQSRGWMRPVNPSGTASS